jgi:RNA recognition motif-containing protein
MKLCVQNLPFSTTEDQLREHFEQIADVSKVTLIYDKETQRPRGFGFVEMGSEDAGNEAISRLNGVELFGRPLRIEIAREREQRPRGDWRDSGRPSRNDRGGYRR